MESIKQSISFSEDKISKLRELVDRYIVELEFKNAALKNEIVGWFQSRHGYRLGVPILSRE